VWYSFLELEGEMLNEESRPERVVRPNRKEKICVGVLMVAVAAFVLLGDHGPKPSHAESIKKVEKSESSKSVVVRSCTESDGINFTLVQEVYGDQPTTSYSWVLNPYNIKVGERAEMSVLTISASTNMMNGGHNTVLLISRPSK
jgi:hypothetical protein